MYSALVIATNHGGNARAHLFPTSTYSINWLTKYRWEGAHRISGEWYRSFPKKSRAVNRSGEKVESEC